MSRWQCCSLLYGLSVSDTILSYTEKGCSYIGQPLLKISLGRTMWNIVDVVVAVLLLVVSV